MKCSNIFQLLLAFASLSSVLGHSHPAPENWKQSNLVARDALEARCGPHLAARREKRALEARNGVLSSREPHKRDLTVRTTNSNDSTTMMTPEVTEGPYHILGQVVRQNLTENQLGVPLEVSVDFVDIETCQGVQVWVDAWHANATGYYSGYVSETGGGAPPFAGPPLTMSPTNPTVGADPTQAGEFLDVPPVDNTTFLRGIYRTDNEGHLTMYSVFPGWYPGRSQHFHIKAIPHGYIACNGTFVVVGNAVHTGQFFFDKATKAAVAATPIYAANLLPYSQVPTNEEDVWYPFQDELGYNADMDIIWKGEHIMDGLIGSINIGLNMSFHSNELSSHWVGFDVEEYKKKGLLPYAHPCT